ncbi:MAG: 4-alpha-glucanotransferase [Treponema sp.]|nr:4-alpha-glucanotransferase [Treponema sp.]
MASKSKNNCARLTGVAVPLGALYTMGSPVIGEYTSLKPFADFCKAAGLGVIQLLPVNDTGTQSSPYSGLSAFALHPIYADISNIAGFKKTYDENKDFKKSYEAFIKNFPYKSRFSYQEILNAKTELLRQIYETTAVAKKSEPDKKFAEWIEKNPWVVEYSVYKNLKWNYMQASWKSWKKSDQLLSQKEILKRWDDEKLKKEHLFYAWMQFNLSEQFFSASEYVKELGIILKGDMPIMMNEDSCDAWAHPEFFNHNLRAGSPSDGENPCGQNWGFPTYNWKNLKKEKYSWWKNRLLSASKYYGAYRLDHILGFFRIWAIPERDSTALLGHAEPYESFTREELNELGFDDSRIRWLSQPHVKTDDIDYFTWNKEKSHEILSLICSQLGDEELWLFKNEISGDKDIYELDLSKQCEKETADKIKQKLAEYWNNRTLIEIEKDKFIPVWTFNQSFAWSTLSYEEKEKLEKLFAEKNEIQNEKWAKQADDILKNFTETVSMCPCGEDLGVNLECVPDVMKKNNILGLNVVRWTRDWGKNGQPYIPFEDYRNLSVTTTSVHDSSTIRQWWQDENESAYLFAKTNQEFFYDVATEDNFLTDTAEEKLKNFTPQIAEDVLKAASKTNSLWFVNPIQDYLYMDIKYWLPESKDERINIPGEVTDFNWTYRMPCPVEDLKKNKDLINKIKAISEMHDGGR